MFWQTYGVVVGWMFAVGTVLGGASIFVFFQWGLPSDGEPSALAITTVIGAGFGAATAAASIVYTLAMTAWTRRTRSASSRGWVGAAAAGAGAFAFWAILGFAMAGPAGVFFWGMVGEVSAFLAMLIAGFAMTWAAKRAGDRTQASHPRGIV